jgi:AAA+ ATPase superfamily predicted ATPase
MAEKFIGREHELTKLRDLRDRKIASLVVIKGRRRIGKSRLVEEFAKDDFIEFFRFSGIPPIQKTTSQDQRDEFARQIGRLFNVPIPYAQDWGDLFWHLSHNIGQIKSKKRILIFFDEISWMGMKDPTFLGKLKTAWDMWFKQNPKVILILCGSVSSWIEKNILKSTGFVGRIDLVFKIEELSIPESLDMLGKLGKNMSHREAFKILSVTGGVPRYLELIDPRYSAEENIKQHCFLREGYLFREFDTIFHDLFSSRSDIYKNILDGLIKNPHASLDDILTYLNRQKTGVLVEYLDDLTQAGFVTRDHTWNLRDGRLSSLSHFRISDNYVRFYLKYLAPNKSKIEKNFYQDRSLTTLPGWETIMGLQFENLVIKNRKKLFNALRLDPSEIINDGPYFQRKTTKHQGCQIDYMIQSRFNSYYICEIKFSNNPIGPQVANEVAQKIKSLNLPKGASCRPVLIHVNGVEDNLIGEEFFAHFIDFKIMAA